MINPAPDFWPISGALGPTAGPGSPGNGPGSKSSAGCTKHLPRIPMISPILWHFVFLGPTAKIMNDKFEAPQGLPRKASTVGSAILFLFGGGRTSSVGEVTPQRDPEVFFGQVLLWQNGELWEPRPKHLTFSVSKWLFGLAAEGGKATKPFFS